MPSAANVARICATSARAYSAINWIRATATTRVETNIVSKSLININTYVNMFVSTSKKGEKKKKFFGEKYFFKILLCLIIKNKFAKTIKSF